MQKIPVILPYQEDELFYSWVARLSRANGIEDMRRFYYCYLMPNADFRYSHRVKSDFREKFIYFWRALQNEHISKRELFFDISTFTGVAPFMSKAQRQRYINQAFHTCKHLEPLFEMPHGSTKHFCLCPQCMEEELSGLGYFYLHRSQNLPGTTVCHKHGMALLKIADTQIRNFSSRPAAEKLPAPTTEASWQYAKFYKDFLDARFDCSMNLIREILLQKLSEADIRTAADYDDLSAGMKALGYADLTASSIPYFLKTGLRVKSYVNISVCCALLLYLFHNVDSVSSAIEEHQKETNSHGFLTHLESAGYQLLGTYRNDLIELCHTDCGTSFCTSPYGFEIGWRCPTCDASVSAENKFSELIDGVGRGEYALQSKFSGMNAEITLSHRTCGRSFPVKARAFLYEGVRCKCLYTVGYEGVRKAIEEHDGFQLVEYKAIDKPLLIRHKCSGEFWSYYSKFIAAPRCRVCERQGHLAKRLSEDFVRDLRDLPGDEYTLVSPFVNGRTRASIRHNVCGTVQEYRPYYFLEGARCRKCAKVLTDQEFRKYVASYSMGRYQVNGLATKNLYSVIDTENGHEITASKIHILQELHRPTPSPILPLAYKSETATPKSSRITDMVLDHVVSSCTRNNLIFTEDIVIDSISQEQLSAGLYHLGKSGKLKRIETGIYGFPETEYTTETVIFEKYILRSGHRIGFFRGESYAYEIGLISDRPADWHIATNKESAKTSCRKIMFMGQTIHIKGVSAEITNRNYLLLETIDFLIQYKQVVDLEEELVLAKIRKHILERNRSKMIPMKTFLPFINSYETKNIQTFLNRIIGKLCEGIYENDF